MTAIASPPGVVMMIRHRVSRCHAAREASWRACPGEITPSRDSWPGADEAPVRVPSGTVRFSRPRGSRPVSADGRYGRTPGHGQTAPPASPPESSQTDSRTGPAVPWSSQLPSHGSAGAHGGGSSGGGAPRVAASGGGASGGSGNPRPGGPADGSGSGRGVSGGGVPGGAPAAGGMYGRVPSRRPMKTWARTRSIRPPLPAAFIALASAVIRAIAAAACTPGNAYPASVAVPSSSGYSTTEAFRSASRRRRSAPSGSALITARRSAACNCPRVSHPARPSTAPST